MSSVLRALAALVVLAAPGLGQGNPLARQPGWVGTWRGEQVQVELRLAGGAAEGEVQVGERAFPLQAKARPDDPALLEGTFTVDGATFAFTFRLESQDAAALASDGATHALTRVKPVANPLAGPKNPLGGGPKEPPSPPNPLGGGPKPQAGGSEALAGAFLGNASKRSIARGAWSFELPEGWTVLNEQGTGLVINPAGGALDPSRPPEGLVMGEIGLLDAAEAQKPAWQAIREAKPNLVALLQGQEISVQDPGDPKEAEVAGLPAGVFEWQGRGRQGQPLSVWLGVLVQKDRYVLLIAILQRGKEGSHLPKVKRMFVTSRMDESVALPGAGQDAPDGGPR